MSKKHPWYTPNRDQGGLIIPVKPRYKKRECCAICGWPEHTAIHSPGFDHPFLSRKDPSVVTGMGAVLELRDQYREDLLSLEATAKEVRRRIIAKRKQISECDQSVCRIATENP